MLYVSENCIYIQKVVLFVILDLPSQIFNVIDLSVDPIYMHIYIHMYSYIYHCLDKYELTGYL